MADSLADCESFSLKGPEKSVEDAFVARLLRGVETTAQNHAVHPLEESRLAAVDFTPWDLPFVLGEAVSACLGDIHYFADKAFPEAIP